MDYEPDQQDSTVTRRPGGTNSTLILIFITLLLFIVALYFEYKTSTSPVDYNEVTIEQPVPLSQQPAPRQPVQIQPQLNPVQQFYQATSRGDLNAMQNMVDQLQAHEINSVTHGMTPIMKASSMGREDMVLFLLAHGADPNKRGSSQRTALQYAAERNRLAVAKILVNNGADINGVDNSNLSPLIMAADRRYHDFAMYLIEQGANVNIQHKQGWTALIDASVSGDVKLVERLLAEGADITAKTTNGWTALDYAQHHKRYDVIPYLIEKQN